MSAVIGHRGAAGLAPENSLAAFEAAARLGVGWVETDARLIAGGGVILFHDNSLLRCLGEARQTDSLTADEAAARGLLLLKDFLPRARKLGLGVNIELKITARAGAQAAESLADAVADHIAAAPASTLLVSSFCLPALARMKRRLPQIPLGLLYRRLPEDWLAAARKLDARTIHLQWQGLQASDIDRITAGGFEAYAYTINDPATAQRLMDAGLSGVFTDYPDRFGLRPPQGPPGQS